MARTAAIVNIYTQDNATLCDAIQFGDPTDLSWSLVGQTFKMEVKASRDDPSPLATFVSPTQIVVLDPIARVIQFNVPDTTIQTSTPCAEYVYDFLMIDTSSPPIRIPLMKGKFIVTKGVTED